MSYIHGISLKNFRVFKNKTDFEFSSFNILTGTNGSGKSSLIKSLLLMHHYFNSTTIGDELNFDAKDHNLANINYALNDTKKPFVVSFPFEWQYDIYGDGLKDYYIEFEFRSSQNKTISSGIIKKISIKRSKDNSKFIELLFNPDEKFTWGLGDPIWNQKRYKLSIDLNACINYINNNSKQDNTKLFENNLLIEYSIFKTSAKSILQYDSIEDILKWQQIFNSDSKYHGLDSYNNFYENITSIDEKSKQIKSKTVINSKPLIINKNLLKYYISNKLSIVNDKLLNEHEYKNLKLTLEEFKNSTYDYSKDDNFVKFLSSSPSFSFDGVFFHTNDSSDVENPNNFKIREWLTPYNSIPETLEFFNYIYISSLYKLLTTGFSEEEYQKYDLSKFIERNILQKFFNLNADGYIESDKPIVEYMPLHWQPIQDFINSLYSSLLSNLQNQFNSRHLVYFPNQRVITERLFYENGKNVFFNDVINEYTILHGNNSETFVHFWIKQFGIAEDIVVERPEEAGNICYLVKNGRKFNIADIGYGFSQLLPIILKIYSFSEKHILAQIPPSLEKTTFIIEEPEANLHPRLQSLFADMIIDANIRYGIQFIIETHSEYLIRRMQYWTAKRKINPKDVNLYYFYQKDKIPKGEKQVKKIKIQDDGRLSSNFGPGFLDESSNLLLELYKLSNSN
jgi:AAA15 family ATPase/GTPase